MRSLDEPELSDVLFAAFPLRLGRCDITSAEVASIAPLQCSQAGIKKIRDKFLNAQKAKRENFLALEAVTLNPGNEGGSRLAAADKSHIENAVTYRGWTVRKDRILKKIKALRTAGITKDDEKEYSEDKSAVAYIPNSADAIGDAKAARDARRAGSNEYVVKKVLENLEKTKGKYLPIAMQHVSYLFLSKYHVAHS